MVIVLHSGGMDSTVALAKAIDTVGRENVLCLSVHYGQRHAKELHAARSIQEYYGVTGRTVDLQTLRPLLKGSSQSDPSVAVPHGHYAAENMKLTVVPNRNMIMLAVAAAGAISEKASEVWYAAHAGDHTIYPDCRPEFVEAVNHALALADWHVVRVVAPFIHQNKSDIAALGAVLRAPLHLTWSCYEGGNEHCGKCGTCVERKEAFRDAGLKDPTKYRE